MLEILDRIGDRFATAYLTLFSILLLIAAGWAIWNWGPLVLGLVQVMLHLAMN